MIWVINAQTFKDNLITKNISGEQLAEIDRRYSTQRSLLNKHNSVELQNIKKKQNAVASEIQSREDDLRALESMTAIFDNFNKNAETFAEQIIIIWQSENLFVDSSLIDIISDSSIPTKKTFFKLLGELKRSKHFLGAAIKNSIESEELYKQRNEILNELESMKPALRKELKSVAAQYLDLEVEITQLKREISFLKLENAENDMEFQDLKNSIDNYIQANLEKLEADFEEEKNNIIKDKDKLTLSWKRERKSWGLAAAPIFFDIGDGNLLYKHADNKVSKVKICDFMGKYNPDES
nr:hypothetical protein [uncultured Flavobacterium sp.]